MLYHPVGIFLARTYFETVPRSMLESARLDGASEIQVLAHIVAPISRPIVTALALFVAMQTLGDYLWQMLQLQRPDSMTMLVGVTRAGMKRGGDIGVVPLGRQMAGAVILLAPVVAVFAGASRYFTSAVGGAVKE
jgi:ABC-type glycerol-3-phosphate transport system permease component